MTGKGGEGYRILAAGKGLKYLALTIPNGAGFEKGDRVCLYPCKRRGAEGVFISKQFPET
jgi:hypothetical protein